jgi:large conductance mechanosensitive channel
MSYDPPPLWYIRVPVSPEQSNQRTREESMLKEFKEFAMRGNVIDMAVGIILGAAFGKIVSSFVADILMPPIGLLLGNVDFSELYLNLTSQEYANLAAAKEAGAATVNYGLWINSVIDFIIVAFAIFLVVRQMNKLKKEVPAAPAPPPAPSKEALLLTEIRDLLKARS